MRSKEASWAMPSIRRRLIIIARPRYQILAKLSEEVAALYRQYSRHLYTRGCCGARLDDTFAGDTGSRTHNMYSKTKAPSSAGEGENLCSLRPRFEDDEWWCDIARASHHIDDVMRCSQLKAAAGGKHGQIYFRRWHRLFTQADARIPSRWRGGDAVEKATRSCPMHQRCSRKRAEQPKSSKAAHQ